jgi:hypothetical protein
MTGVFKGKMIGVSTAALGRSIGVCCQGPAARHDRPIDAASEKIIVSREIWGSLPAWLDTALDRVEVKMKGKRSDIGKAADHAVMVAALRRTYRRLNAKPAGSVAQQGRRRRRQQPAS